MNSFTVPLMGCRRESFSVCLDDQGIARQIIVARWFLCHKGVVLGGCDHSLKRQSYIERRCKNCTGEMDQDLVKIERVEIEFLED